MVIANACARCERAAYAAESIDVDEKRYHRNCFKCAECGTKLSSATFSTVSGTLYCKNHALERGVRTRPNVGMDAMEISTYARRRRAANEAGDDAKSTRDDAGDVKSTTTTMATTTTVSEASRRVNALLVRVRCERCEKSAYPAESVDVDGKRWHRGCFKCFECGTTLSLTTFVTCDGEAYCAKDGLARQRAKRERDAERTETREEDPAAAIEPELAVERRLEGEADAVEPTAEVVDVTDVEVEAVTLEAPESKQTEEETSEPVAPAKDAPESVVENPVAVIEPELAVERRLEGEADAVEPTAEVVDVTAEVEAVTLEAPESKQTEEETSEPVAPAKDAPSPLENVSQVATIDETIPKPRANGGGGGGGGGRGRGGKKKKKGRGGRK
jgi:hypothetical protein